jgi:hypothetical protein
MYITYSDLNRKLFILTISTNTKYTFYVEYFGAYDNFICWNFRTSPACVYVKWFTLLVSSRNTNKKRIATLSQVIADLGGLIWRSVFRRRRVSAIIILCQSAGSLHFTGSRIHQPEPWQMSLLYTKFFFTFENGFNEFVRSMEPILRSMEPILRSRDEMTAL